MELNRMELRDLQIFMAIVKHGSYTKAANVLFISQPTLSKSMKRLENELQAQLLQRTTRQLQVTDIGAVVYEHGQKILYNLQELGQSIQDIRDVQLGTIKLGIPPLIGTLFFPEIARAFHQEYPKVTLELVERGAKRISELVHSGQVDVAFVVLPIVEPTFTIVPFIEDDFVLYVHKEHPFAQCAEVSVEDLKNEKFVLFSNEYALHDFVIRSCENEGFSPDIVYKSSQWDLIVELIGLNLGVTILPRAIYEKQSNPNVKIIPLTDSLIWKIGLVSLKDRYKSFALQELVKMIHTESWSWQSFIPLKNK